MGCARPIQAVVGQRLALLDQYWVDVGQTWGWFRPLLDQHWIISPKFGETSTKLAQIMAGAG